MTQLLYRETMNSIYRCAILNTRLNIGNTIIKIIQNPDQSAITDKLKSDTTGLEKQIQTYGCRNLSSNTSDNS